MGATVEFTSAMQNTDRQRPTVTRVKLKRPGYSSASVDTVETVRSRRFDASSLAVVSLFSSKDGSGLRAAVVADSCVDAVLGATRVLGSAIVEGVQHRGCEGVAEILYMCGKRNTKLPTMYGGRTQIRIDATKHLGGRGTGPRYARRMRAIQPTAAMSSAFGRSREIRRVFARPRFHGGSTQLFRKGSLRRRSSKDRANQLHC